MGGFYWLLGDIPRYGSCHDGLCSVKSFGVIFFPASSIATRMPAAVSFLAAQPPVAPEPTTMASKGSFGETICSIKRSISRGQAGPPGICGRGVAPTGRASDVEVEAR